MSVSVVSRFSASSGLQSGPLVGASASTVTVSTVVVAAILAAVLAILATMAVVLGVRRYRRSKNGASGGKKWQSNGGRLFVDGSLSYMSKMTGSSTTGTLSSIEDDIASDSASVSPIT